LELSWHVASPIIRNMPSSVISDIDHSLSRWLENVAKNLSVSLEDVLPIVQALLEADINPNSLTNSDGDPIGKPIMEAINHPIGKVSAAVISLWFKTNPTDGEELPNWLSSNLSTILQSNEPRFRHGKTIVAQHLIALYRVDPQWTRFNLIPLFDWNSEEKVVPISVWEGFLVSARVYPPLMSELKQYFLDTATNYEHLEERPARYVSVLTVMGLESIPDYSNEDFITAFRVLPQEALNESVRTIYESIKGAGDRSDQYWKNRVKPFWKEIWPKSKDLVSQEISEFLIRIILETEHEIPAATDTLINWLIPFQHLFYITHDISKSGMCQKHPQEILRILNAIIDEQKWFRPTELQDCLEQIRSTQPDLRESPIFTKLNDYVLARSS